MWKIAPFFSYAIVRPISGKRTYKHADNLFVLNSSPQERELVLCGNYRVLRNSLKSRKIQFVRSRRCLVEIQQVEYERSAYFLKSCFLASYFCRNCSSCGKSNIQLNRVYHVVLETSKSNSRTVFWANRHWNYLNRLRSFYLSIFTFLC